jgi:hypothetical protein
VYLNISFFFTQIWAPAPQPSHNQVFNSFLYFFLNFPATFNLITQFKKLKPTMLEHHLIASHTRAVPQRPVHKLGRDFLHQNPCCSLDTASGARRLVLLPDTAHHIFNVQSKRQIIFMSFLYFFIFFNFYLIKQKGNMWESVSQLSFLLDTSTSFTLILTVYKNFKSL